MPQRVKHSLWLTRDGFRELKVWKAAADAKALLTLIHRWSISYPPLWSALSLASAPAGTSKSIKRLSEPSSPGIHQMGAWITIHVGLIIYQALPYLRVCAGFMAGWAELRRRVWGRMRRKLVIKLLKAMRYEAGKSKTRHGAVSGCSWAGLMRAMSFHGLLLNCNQELSTTKNNANRCLDHLIPAPRRAPGRTLRNDST